MRRPAHFRYRRPSAIADVDVTWRITVSEAGVEATRSFDRRHLAAPWERILEALIRSGYDSTLRPPGERELRRADRRARKHR